MIKQFKICGRLRDVDVDKMNERAYSIYGLLLFLKNFII